MPYPLEYALSTQTWQQVLDAVKVEADLSTSNQAFTVLEGVLRAFRRRLTVQDSLRFADALPVPVRALYVHDRDVAEERMPFRPPLELADEVRSLRKDHNFAPDTAVPDVARALRRFVHPSRFDALSRPRLEGQNTSGAADRRFPLAWSSCRTVRVAGGP